MWFFDLIRKHKQTCAGLYGTFSSTFPDWDSIGVHDKRLDTIYSWVNLQVFTMNKQGLKGTTRFTSEYLRLKGGIKCLK